MSDPRTSIQFTIKNLEGKEKKYFLQPLRRKDAAFVAHNFLRALLKGLSGINQRKMKGDGQAALLQALSDIDFDLLWGLAEVMLRYSTIKQGKDNPIIEIEDLNETDYFDENPEELYLAVFNGIKENFPKVFTKVRGLLGGLGQKATPDQKDSKSEKSDTV